MEILTESKLRLNRSDYPLIADASYPAYRKAVVWQIGYDCLALLHG